MIRQLTNTEENVKIIREHESTDTPTHTAISSTKYEIGNLNI